jgi:hypothetical protein
MSARVVFAVIAATIVVLVLFFVSRTGQPGFGRDGGS